MNNRYCNFIGKQIIFSNERKNIWIGLDDTQNTFYLYYGNFQDYDRLKNDLFKLIKWFDSSLNLGYIKNRLSMKEHTSSLVFRIKFRDSDQMKIWIRLIELENYGIESE